MTCMVNAVTFSFRMYNVANKLPSTMLMDSFAKSCVMLSVSLLFGVGIILRLAFLMMSSAVVIEVPFIDLMRAILSAKFAVDLSLSTAFSFKEKPKVIAIQTRGQMIRLQLNGLLNRLPIAMNKRNPQNA